MKNIAVALLAAIFIIPFLSGSNLFAQDPDYQLEVPTILQIPQAPQSASMARYGNIPVDYAHGLSQISIPLYSIEYDGVEVPISLSYHAGGISVNQIATSVGLGWTLHAGGEISRTINMLADDEAKGWLNISSANHPAYMPDSLILLNGDNDPDEYPENWEKFKEVSLSKYDIQPDRFSYSFNDHSGSFVISKDDTIREAEKSNLLFNITYNNCAYPNLSDVPLNFFTGSSFINTSPKIEKFSVKDRVGNIYAFEDLEYNSIRDSDPSFATVVAGCSTPASATQSVNTPGVGTTGWKLSKITTKNLNDIDFYYKQYETTASVVSSDPANTYQVSECISAISPGQSSSRDYISINKLIDSISIGDIAYIKFHYSDTLEYAVWELALDSIRVHDKITGNVKCIELDYSYFYNDGEKRLKLTKVTDKGWNNASTNFMVHEFSYNDLQFKRNSKGQDVFGFYNGATSNTTLIPYYISGLYANGYREINHSTIGSGLLSKITYPTSGFSKLFYEPNYDVLSNGDSIYTAGTRINKIISFSSSADTSGIISYEYIGLSGDTHRKYSYSAYQSGTRYFSSPQYNYLRTQGFYYDSVYAYPVVINDSTFRGLGGWVTEEVIKHNGKEKYAYGSYASGNTYRPYLKSHIILAKGSSQMRTTTYGYAFPANNTVKGLAISDQYRTSSGAPACCWSMIYDDFYWMDFKYSDEAFLKLSETTTEFLNGSSLQKTKSYTYENSLNLVDEIEITGSNEDITRKYQYKNEGIPSSGIQNFDALLIRESIFKDDDQTDEIYTIYDVRGNPIRHSRWNPLLDQYEWIDSIKYLSGINKPVELITFRGDTTSIIYDSGYNPIAVANGVSIERIYHTSFEEDASAIVDSNAKTGNKVKTITSQFAINGAFGHGNEYIVAYYWRSGPTADWELQRENKTCAGSLLTTSKSTGQIDELRVFPSDAQMNTFTQDPLIGISSQTDPNGITTYYVNDSQGRLVRILDQNKKVLKEYKYNYTNQ